MEDHAHGQKKDQEYLETIFHLFDKDNDGRITAEELTTVLESLKMHLNKKELKEQVDKVMADGDKDKNGTIDFDEFLVFMEARMAHHEGTLKEMRDAFRMFDCDSNGFIEADELKSVMLKLGNDLSTKEVEAMIKDADLDGNGKIDFDEFVKYMMEKE
ncbi:neo-calmodulin-like [Mizuhopecten yessoensis]|nr:neo-calmodulin-like [Mizuhopecten yessoensis]